MDLSVVIPVRDEVESAGPLIAELDRVLVMMGRSEIVVVDDGSEDGTGRLLAGMAPCRSAHLPRLVVRRHAEPRGKSAALRTGVQAAAAPWVATLDGDGQDDPRELPTLWSARLAARRDGGPVLVAGYRRRRHDSLMRRASSRLANALARCVLRDGARDRGCGMKLFPRQAFLDLPFFENQHRFLAALFLRDGVSSVHVPVTHRPRRAGRSKYGVANRLVVGLVDLAGVAWLQRRGSPVRLENHPLSIARGQEGVEIPGGTIALEVGKRVREGTAPLRSHHEDTP